MKSASPLLTAIEIDKLTNSIENAVTGDVFETDILPVSAVDLKIITKKNGWLFNWRKEARQLTHKVFKLTIAGNPTIVQGIVSLEVKSDHLYLHLVESAPFNRGKQKTYVGVPGNLFAFACKLSFQHGHEGNVAFVSKTQLIAHYSESLRAIHFGGHLMILDTIAARKLIVRYFKDFQP